MSSVSLLCSAASLLLLLLRQCCTLLCKLGTPSIAQCMSNDMSNGLVTLARFITNSKEPLGIDGGVECEESWPALSEENHPGVFWQVVLYRWNGDR